MRRRTLLFSKIFALGLYLICNVLLFNVFLTVLKTDNGQKINFFIQHERQGRQSEEYAVSLTRNKEVFLRRDIETHVWQSVCSTGVSKSFLNSPLFPNYPQVRLLTKGFRTYSMEEAKYVQKTFGILIPTSTDSYVFLFTNERYSPEKTLNVFLFLSTDAKKENKRIVYLWKSIYTYQAKRISSPVHLESHKEYYIELIIHFLGNPVKIKLLWAKASRRNFSVISPKHLKPFLKKKEKEEFDSLSTKTEVEGGLWIQGRTDLQAPRHMYVHWNNISDALPACYYTPNYMPLQKKMARYSGYRQKVVQTRTASQIFPMDETYEYLNRQNCALVNGNKVDRRGSHCYGNRFLDEASAMRIVKLFFSSVEKRYPSEYKFSEIIRVERRENGHYGVRYFLEIEVISKNRSFLISEYVYQPNKQQLCYPVFYQWKKDVMVNVILTAKDQPSWVQFFVDGFSNLYVATGDPNFNVIIVDFGNLPVDVERELKKSQIPHYRYIRRNGTFYKTQAIQDAAATVTNPDEIIFLMDLHIQIPTNLIDVTRKHCIQGRMTWNPICLRLNCGSFPDDIFGFWEEVGYGLFAVYKSDWDRFGGMNVEEFRDKWGGEDWEMLDRVLENGLDVERMKVPEFFHYFHSKENMWNNDN